MTRRKTLIVTALLLGSLSLCRPAVAAKPPILRGPNSTERIAVIHAVALTPIDCPGTLDCASSENELIAYLRGKLHLKVVSSARLSQLLFERSIAVADLLSTETGPPLLKELGVSALLVPRVLDYHRVDKYLGGGPGVELRAELELLIPGAPPLAKGNDTDGGPDMQLAGKPPLGRIFVRLAEAIFESPR